MHLVLFDIDGTLISTGGAGMRAFYRALRDVFDIDCDVFEINGKRPVIRPDGKTDPLIAKELLTGFGMENQWSDNIQEALFFSYLLHLEDEMSRAKEENLVRVLPGVVELLETLSSDPGFCVGLVTGNLEKGAHIKLRWAGLIQYFRFGGYGSDSENRTELIRLGIQRGTQAAAPGSVDGVFVFGDTPLDIIHGHAAGAKVIAVASAGYSLDDLEFHNPDLLLANLMPSDAIIRFMTGRVC
jgi:phosphoglycolate phosphatase-like HAD superfamily hydrolase